MKNFLISVALFLFTALFGLACIWAYDNDQWLMGTILAGAFLWCAAAATGRVLYGEDA